MNIDKLYQQTILEYSKNKENNRELDEVSAIERGHNPSCGDDLTLMVKEKDGIIEDASFLGLGCAISTASTNMLIDTIVGKSVDEAKEIVDIFFKMLSGEEITDDERDMIGDAEILEMVANMPARIKCATLSWHSARVVIDKIKTK